MQSEVCIVRNMIVFFQLYIQYILLQASLEKLTFDIDLMDKKNIQAQSTNVAL